MDNDFLIRFLRNLSHFQNSTSRVPNSSDPLTLDSSLNYCSYTLGYIEQNIYTCKTCSILSGLCIGCCLTCHKGHEIIDIGPKKDFRCDCGVEKYSCKLFPKKGRNSNNYSHNFFGRFCVCDSWDSDLTRLSALHLCVSCFDWFHEDCIQIYNDCHNFAAKQFHSKDFPRIPEDSENYFLLCEKCVNQNLFLVNKFRAYFALESAVQDWKPVQKFPYHVFISKNWLQDRCECLECCSIELPSVQFRSFKKFMKNNEDQEPVLDFSLEFLQAIMQESHEDQVHIAHGLVILQSLAQESLRTSFRLNFRSEVEELRKRMVELREDLN